MRNDNFKIWIRNILIFVVSVFIIFTVGCVRDEDHVLDTQRGSVSGIVIDSNKLAVSGAIVTSNRSLFKAETDEMGRFMFTSLDEGHHHLTVERDGFYLGSATIELAYSQVLDNLTIVVDSMEKMVKASVAVKEKTKVVLDIDCHEEMSVSVTYRELSNMPSTTTPDAMATKHRITLNNLYPDSTYYFTVTGKTADGRTFTTEQSSFKTVSLYDIEGAPDTPIGFNITQTIYGPQLSWNYNGQDPIKGFRIYRSENGGRLALLRDENDVLSSQLSLVDDLVAAGRYYTYNLYAVDLEGNLSELPAIKSFIPTGTIHEDIVWKKEWSPIDIGGDITIPSRYTLTIEAGTSIRFFADSNAANTFKNSLCEFIVEGTIIARGTEAEPIKFLSQSSTPQRNDWDGIRFMASIGENKSQFSNVVFSGADTALKLYSGNLDIDNVKAIYCKTGIALITASGTVIHGVCAEDCETGVKAENTFYCTLSDIKANSCDVGVILNNNTGLTLKDFDVRNSKNSGVQAYDKTDTRIRNGVINSHAKGLEISGESCDTQFLTIDAVSGIQLEGATNAVIKNNIIVNLGSNGTGNGIEDMYTSGLAFPYNNIYGFKTATVNCTQSGAAIHNVDPFFEGETADGFDYHLQSGSSLLDVASNKGQIGAYGAE